MEDRTIEIKLYWLKLRIKFYLKQKRSEVLKTRSQRFNRRVQVFSVMLMILRSRPTANVHRQPPEDFIYCPEPQFIKWKNTPL